MSKGKAFLIDVGIQNFLFPIRAFSKREEAGQPTIATISIKARIMKEFEAEWINKFINIAHKHRETIGTDTLKTNIKDYVEELHANSVQIEMEYPYFVEKTTPKSQEPCLMKYNCKYVGKYPSLDNDVKIIFGIECPIITTYPVGNHSGPKKGYLPQLSKLFIEIEPNHNIFPEDVVDLADKNSLSPIYSYVTKEDQQYIIERTQSDYHSSIDTTDSIRQSLAHNPEVNWFSINCSNLGMIHSYTTLISTEKSHWVPGSYFDMDEI